MNGTFDNILTLIFLVLAVVIFLKLRSVLGRRTGHERPYDSYSTRDANGNPVQDNVVTLPRGEPARIDNELDEETFARSLKKVAKEGSDVAQGLQTIAKADRSFDPMQFMQGAKAAYEMIVTAFAEGDRKTLKQLLSRDVYDSFTAAISDREKRNETVDFKFVGISSAEISEAELSDKIANITIKFVSDVITATRNSAGEIINGSETAITDVTDGWTFSRDTTSRDPNWHVVATGMA